MCIRDSPYDAARDSSFNGDTEKNLESQLVLTYVDDKNEQSRLWSSADCAELGQFRAEETAAGVRFQLSIGKEAVDFQIPAAFTVEPVSDTHRQRLIAKVGE